jgi:hypothetical protein
MFAPMSFLSSLMQSVRVRTLVVLCAVVVAVLACLGWWTHRVLGQSFEQLEAAEEFQFTWNMIITAIAVTGGIIAVAVAIIFEVGVHARLIRLSKDLAEIAQTNDQVSLVYAGGTDEIGRLGMEINRLLASQRGWREQISRRNASMRLIFDTLPIGLLSVDTLGRIQPDRSSATAELLGRPDLEGLDLGDLLVPGSSNLTTRRRLSDYLAIVRGGTIDAVGLDEVNPLKTVTVQSGKQHGCPPPTEHFARRGRIERRAGDLHGHQ